MTTEEWKRLKILKGKSSYSQERIWLDESIRIANIKTDEKLFNYNSILIYQIEDGFLYIKRFRQALKYVLNKHEIFRTSLDYDSVDHCIKQIIHQPNDDNYYSFELTHLDVNDIEKMNQLIYKEQISKYFDLNNGTIFRCHLLQQYEGDKNRLIKNDYILFIFHHSAIDQYSKYLFLKELTYAYQNEKLNLDENQLRYIDFSYYERQLNLNKVENFWEDLFSDYDFKLRIDLPYDDKMFNGISSGSYYAFYIDKSLTRQIFRYKQKHNINLFRLFLSTFYAFIFKLTKNEDICITGITGNRYRNELNNIIGPFENINIYRLQLDPHKSFNELIKQVEQLCLNIKDNSYYPYQNLIGYLRKFSSIQYPFSQISLRVFIEDDQWKLNPDDNLILKQILLTNHEIFKRDDKLTPIDLTLNVICNIEKSTIEFYFDYSNKLFEEQTIQTLAERFQKILKHLFDVSSNFDLDEEPIYKLSIILPREELLVHNINMDRN